MSTSQPSYQTFVTLINGQRRIWATTPMLWLMSIQAQSPDLFSAAYTTMGKPMFSWMPTSTLLALRLANGRRPKQPTFTAFDLTVPPVVVLNLPSSRGNVSLVLDGNHRIDVLADSGVSHIQVLQLPPKVASRFEVPPNEVSQVWQALGSQQTAPALAKLYLTLNPMKKEADLLRDGGRAAGKCLSDLPLPRTLLHQGLVKGPPIPEVF